MELAPYIAIAGMQVLSNLMGQQSANSQNSAMMQMSAEQFAQNYALSVQQFNWTRQYQQGLLGVQQGQLALGQQALQVNTGLTATGMSGGWAAQSTSNWFQKAYSDYAFNYNQGALAENAVNNKNYNTVLGVYEVAGLSSLQRLTNLVSGKTDPLHTTAYELRDKAALKAVDEAARARGMGNSGRVLKEIADYTGQQAVNDLTTQAVLERSIAYGGMPFAERLQRPIMPGAADPNATGHAASAYDHWMAGANHSLSNIADSAIAHGVNDSAGSHDQPRDAVNPHASSHPPDPLHSPPTTGGGVLVGGPDR